MVTTDDLRLDVVDEDGLVPRTKDGSVFRVDNNASNATVTVFSVHLNWKRICIFAKDFTDVLQSHAFVLSTGDQD